MRGMRNPHVRVKQIVIIIIIVIVIIIIFSIVMMIIIIIIVIIITIIIITITSYSHPVSLQTAAASCYQPAVCENHVIRSFLGFQRTCVHCVTEGCFKNYRPQSLLLCRWT